VRDYLRARGWREKGEEENMSIENNETLPRWTMSGGFLRSGFSTNDVPTKWTRRSGKWTRGELVPYGKATLEYREQFYLCPECQKALEISETPYRFECSDCGLKFNFSFGGLGEVAEDTGRYTPCDLYV